MSFDNQKQYLEGDTDSTIRGTAILWEDTSDILRSVSASKPLPVSSGERGLSGTGADTTITLTSANIAYAVPASAPSTDFILTLSNQSDTNMLWGFENSGTLGNLLVANTGLASMRLAGGQVIYARCASAGKVLNYSTKIV